jgi:MoaA/NifB/PqqE/SkfB family radical SAM enzyme
VEKYHCHTIHSIITINYYGDILPCNYLQAQHNINERKPLVELWNQTCAESRKLFRGGWYHKECCGCTSSIEMGVLCSGIRYPFHNIRAIPKIAGIAISKMRKQRAFK